MEDKVCFLNMAFFLLLKELFADPLWELVLIVKALDWKSGNPMFSFTELALGRSLTPSGP